MGKPQVGEYYIDKYNLNDDEMYMHITNVYRIDRIDETGENRRKIFCTKLSLCHGDRKKTNENVLVEAKVSCVDFGKNVFTHLMPATKEDWESISEEVVMATIGTTGLETGMERYCRLCENFRTELCRLCCMVDGRAPTKYVRKKKSGDEEDNNSR